MRRNNGGQPFDRVAHYTDSFELIFTRMHKRTRIHTYTEREREREETKQRSRNILNPEKLRVTRFAVNIFPVASGRSDNPRTKS
jgi:hypothetical protein